MRFLATALLAATTAATTAGADPVADCRAAHAGDSAAHIACLENALRARLPAATVAPAALSPTAPAAASTAAPVAVAAVPVAAQPTGLGAEQAKARQRPLDAPPEQTQVRIVSARYTAEGLGIFTLADGQVWRETTPSVKRYRLKPDREYPGRIETSKIGGYRLYLEGIRWMYKVERLK